MKHLKTIPTLTGIEAKQFIERADYTKKHLKGSIDFREKHKICKAILKKAKLK